MTARHAWPALRVEDWEPTRTTLHLWTQIVGKIRMSKAPMLNHWWQVPLYVTTRGLTTSAIPDGNRLFDVDFDFISHELRLRSSDGGEAVLALGALSVAEFLDWITSALRRLDVEFDISAGPNEVELAVPFADDREHASYDALSAHLFWRQLAQAHRVMTEFRSRFAGKVSPVHFFWGSFDLACTRFSGRQAPRWSGRVPNCADWVMVEAYSHEVSSCGFWPGGGAEGAFYSYAYPVPDAFAAFDVRPSGAFYSEEFGQFLLPWEAARTATDPDAAVLDFLQSTYEAAVQLGQWPRDGLETDLNRLHGHGHRRGNSAAMESSTAG